MGYRVLTSCPHVFLCVALICSFVGQPASAAAQGSGELRPTKYLTPLDIPAADRPNSSLLGVEVQIRGRWAFVGSLWAEAVFVYENVNGTWQYRQKLTGTGPTGSPALFGTAIAVADFTADVVLVGAPSEDHVAVGDNRGAAYVFHYSSATNQFVRVGRLAAPDASDGAQFGSEVTLLGNTVALIGATLGGPGGSGAVYAFRRPSGAIWNYLTQLLPTAGTTSFGGAIAGGQHLGNGKQWVVVGSPNSNGGRGTVDVFEWNPVTGAVLARQTLVPSEALAGDNVGFELSMGPTGDVVLVGAPGTDIAGRGDEGAAYLLDSTASGWVFGPRLVTPAYGTGGKAGDRFGTSLSLQYGWALIGSPNFGSSGAQYGAVFVFARDHTTGVWNWSTVALAANDEYADNEFGISLDTDGERVLVGARFDENDGRPSNGSAHFFDIYWRLSISFSGQGSGRVTSSPNVVECNSSTGPCAVMIPANTGVRLTAHPNLDSVFGEWSSDCIGGDAYLQAPAACNVRFDRFTGCSYTVNPSTDYVDAAGGSRTVSVTTNSPLCGWGTTSNVPWLAGSTVTPLSTTSAEIVYTALPNSTKLQRVGVLSVGTATATIIQRPGIVRSYLDVDGNGLGDIVLYNETTGSYSVRRSRPGSLLSIAGGQWATGWKFQRARWNDDNLDDLFLYNPTNGLYRRGVNMGNGSFVFYGSGWAPNWKTAVVDFNGDGLSDVFLYNPTTGVWFRALSLPGYHDFVYTSGVWATGWQVFPADFNGDGRSDLFLYNNTAGHVYAGAWTRVFTTADGTFSYAGYDVRWAYDWQVTPADFNGDGRTDLFLYRPGGQWFRVTFSDAGSSYNGGTWAPNWTIRTGDFNGDEKTDLFLYNTVSGQWFVAVFDGHSFLYYGGQWAPNWEIDVTEFNADGLSDLLLQNRTTGMWFQAVTTTPGAFSFWAGNWGPGWLAITR